MQKFGPELEGTGRTATVVRLRAENEEKAQRAIEMQELNKEMQDEKFKQMQLSMLSTSRKMLDFEKRKQAEQQMRTEEAERKRQEVLVKNTQINLYEQAQKEQIARRIAE